MRLGKARDAEVADRMREWETGCENNMADHVVPEAIGSAPFVLRVLDDFSDEHPAVAALALKTVMAGRALGVSDSDRDEFWTGVSCLISWIFRDLYPHIDQASLSNRGHLTDDYAAVRRLYKTRGRSEDEYEAHAISLIALTFRQTHIVKRECHQFGKPTGDA